MHKLIPSHRSIIHLIKLTIFLLPTESISSCMICWSGSAVLFPSLTVRGVRVNIVMSTTAKDMDGRQLATAGLFEHPPFWPTASSFWPTTTSCTIAHAKWPGREEKSIRCLNCLQVVCLVVAEYVYRLKSSELTSARLTHWPGVRVRVPTPSPFPIHLAPSSFWPQSVGIDFYRAWAIAEIEGPADRPTDRPTDHFMTFLITYFA